MLRKIILLLALSCLVLTGCSQKEAEVAARPIDPSLDICHACKMSIVDLHFAGQVVDHKDQVLNFDDIGCMISYLKKNSEVEKTAKGMFVTDYKTKEWVKVGTAHFVRGRLDTPMSSGIAALSEETEAQQLADRIEGKLLSWEEVKAAHQPKPKTHQPEAAHQAGGVKGE